MQQHSSVSPIAKALKSLEANTGFKPQKDRAFYQRLGIAPKRFNMLEKGLLDITLKEAQQVASVFSIPLADLL